MENLSKEVKKFRKSEFDIDPIFVNRWSPRSMTGEELSDEELMPLFEAARWAPSSGNAQTWRFIYAKRNTKHFEKFLGLPFEGNQSWAKNAAVLMIVISRKSMEYKDKPAPTHTFDTGSAWMSLALEGSRRGLVVHGMAGFDYEKARELLKLSDLYTVEAMAAIGKRGKKEDLPDQLQERERPSERKPIKEIAFEGDFDSSK